MFLPKKSGESPHWALTHLSLGLEEDPNVVQRMAAPSSPFQSVQMYQQDKIQKLSLPPQDVLY